MRCGSRLDIIYMPISFSGVSTLASSNLASELLPTPGMSQRLQSWRGREMKLENFLVVDNAVDISRTRNQHNFIWNVLVLFFLFKNSLPVFGNL